MQISKLIFFPKVITHCFNTNELLENLINCAFIETTAYKENHYLPGESFLNLITFLGCSPNINLAPVEDENHCYISIIKQTDKTKCLGFTQTIHPKCPSCKKRIADWKTIDWQEPDKKCICDKCNIETLYAELNWKNECGFARSGFEINHIYPHEAVPTDQLLEKLNQFSKIEWNYCYSSS